MIEAKPKRQKSDPDVVLAIGVLTIAGICFAQTDFFVQNTQLGMAIGGLCSGILMLTMVGIARWIRRASNQRAEMSSSEIAEVAQSGVITFP